MIQVYCDYSCLLQPQQDHNTLILANASDYIPIRQRIRQALDNPNAELTIYVHNPVLAHWLEDIRAYGQKLVRWEEVRLRDRFKERFGTHAPAELSDFDILTLGLLDIPLHQAGEMVDVPSWILGIKLDKVWDSATPGDSHLASLAAWAAIARVPPELAALSRAQLKRWATIDARYQVFTQGLTNAGERVLLRWALRSYPESFPPRAELSQFPLVDCSQYASLCARLLERYDKELGEFWGEWLARNKTADASMVLQLMSGLSASELQALETVARLHPEALTPVLLAEIEHKFTALSRESVAAVVDELRTLIPPQAPVDPDSGWNTKQWLDWAVNQYMPYFDWVMRTGHPREKQLAMGVRFGDWLVDAYPDMLFDPEGPLLTNTKKRISRELKGMDSANTVVLWLIVDGLAWWQASWLSGKLTVSGHQVEYADPILSALPSVTTISKRALVQGTLERTQDNRSIIQVLQSCPTPGGGPLSVYRQHSELKKAIKGGLLPGLHVLFYNDLDHHSHGSDSFSDQVVDGHLREVASLASDAFRVGRAHGNDVVVFVSSDHGCTLLPPDVVALQPPRIAKMLEDGDIEIADVSKSDQRTRCCVLRELPVGEQREEIEKNWRVLPGDMYNLPGDYLMPKGYAAVGKRTRNWTHGGATPEETVTAFMKVLPKKLSVIKPRVDIDTRLLTNATVPMRVVVTNPNDFPIKRVRLTVSISQEPIFIGDIEGHGEANADMVAQPAAGKGSAQSVKWMLEFYVGGAQHEALGDTEVPVRRLRSSDDDLFDL